MPFSTLNIKMLGDFSLEYNNNKISDCDNRSKKVWILLAYLIYYRNRAIPKEEVISLLWHNEKKLSDTNNLLKAIFHRLRKFLENLDLTLSKELISLNRGYFNWNHDVPLKLDIDEFENLCNSGLNSQNSAARLSFFLKAIDLYNGRFLSRMSGDFKLLSVSSFFHNLYMQISQQTVLLLEHQNKHENVCKICKKCCQLDPYDEFFYQHLMKNMVYTSSASDITSIYYDMERLFETSLGTKPSSESINIFHLATNKNDNKNLNSEDIFSNIKIKSADGCFFCNYNTFQAIHRFVACSISRSNNIANIALLSIKDVYGNMLSERSLYNCNEQLDSLLKNHLRKSDVVCRYNNSKYLILLYGSQYNCSKALDRILYLYKRSYPRSPAVLSYSLNEINPII